MRSRVALLLAVPALLAAGCGAPPSSAEDFEGEERAVAETVEDIQRAGERQEADRICRDFLTRALRDRIAQGGENCAEEMEKAIKDADSVALDVDDVTVTGTSATARVTADGRPDDLTRTLQFTKEGGRWRASSLGS